MAIIIVHPKASSLQICRRKCNLSSHILLTKAPHLFAFAALLILRIFILQSTQHAPHPVFECFFCFFQMSSLFASTIPRWFFETHRHLSLCYCLVSLAPPSSFDGWLSLTHISGFEYACLCFLFSASSLHITQSVWFFVRGNYWLRSQPSARCFSLSLFSLSSYLSDFHSVPLSFSFLQSPFGLPIVLAFFSGPCVPLTLSLTHFARSHRWVNHTAGLSLNLSFLPTPMHVHKDHQRAGKLI